jgi:D-alanyl-D-alanine carboxypeptidase
VTPPFAHGYGRLSELKGDLYDGSGYLPFETLATAAWAAGAIASTPRDVARWLYLLCTGVVLGDDYTAEMVADDPPSDYGLGVARPIIPGIGPAIGHVGQIPGYVALGFYLVDSGTVVVVVTNTDVDPEDLGLVLVELSEIVSRP